MTGSVVAAGWHDTYMRWDLSTPQAVVERLAKLDAVGPPISQPGRRLYAERDRFGKWRHLLGPQNVLISYTVDSPSHGLIRRLELQAHLGESGEDDLCPVDEFERRWKRTQILMAMVGVRPPEEPGCVRADPAVDVLFDDPHNGWRLLQALRFARWPNRWHAEYQGPPPYTTVAVKSGTKTVGRAYCRNTKLRNGGPRWGKIRLEREQRFEWKDRWDVAELAAGRTASTFWGTVFGNGVASGRVTRLERELQTVKLAERVELGELTTAQYEQVAGFLDAERLGLGDRIYKPETARRRRALLATLGIAANDAATEPLDESLDELLAVPRSAWAPLPDAAPAAARGLVPAAAGAVGGACPTDLGTLELDAAGVL